MRTAAHHIGVLLSGVGQGIPWGWPDQGRALTRALLPVPRKANGVLEARQLAMRIFEDYTVSWYWIVM